LNAIAEKKVPYLNGGNAICSFVYAENLAQGIKFLYENNDAHGPYIIVDVNITWRCMIETICEIGGFKKPKLSVSYKLICGLVWLLESGYKLFRIKKPPVLNIYRLKIQASDLGFSGKRIQELGFKSNVDLETALRRTISYYKNEFKKQS
jgi:nucleoside-diphosphate-sugar epimerase